MKKINIVLLLLVSLSFSGFSQNIDLFIWAGQSNAQGRQGDAAGYPADTDNLDNQIQFNWTRIGDENSAGWVTMGPQVGIFPTGHFGPEVTFSRNLIGAGYNPAIFKYTRGNTNLAQDWGSPGAGGHYDEMITDLNAAITALENLGNTVTIRGLVWIQGEADSDNEIFSAAYFGNLTSMIADIRSVANNNALPIILGIDEQYPGLLNPQVLTAHQDIALNDSHIKFTSMYGFPKADITHLTPEGLIAHGESIFETFQLLVAEEYPASNCTLSSGGDVVSIFSERSWGQSFTTDCSGFLSAITFSAASVLDNSATFNLFNSTDCTGTLLISQTINSVEIGDNVVTILSELYLEKEHTYYFEIIANVQTDTWAIHYSNTNTVFGNLKTTYDGILLSSCSRNFPSFDLNFSVEITAPILSVDDYTATAIKLFPNPSNGLINLPLDGEQNVSVKVFDITGQMVYQAKGITNSFYLHKKSGMYLVEVIFENGKHQYCKLVME